MSLREPMTRNADAAATRELAQWLVAYEANDAGLAASDAQAAGRVCDKLRRPLTTLAGEAGYRSLLARALTLAKKESACFAAWEVSPDGSLLGLSGDAMHAGAVLVTQVIGLMITFIGEALTLRFLHDVWLDLPDANVTSERDDAQ